MLLACIKYLSHCPCPRCLIVKTQIPAMGTKADERHRGQVRNDDDHLQRAISRARECIFMQGIGVTGKWVQQLVGEKSCMPIQVCYSYYKAIRVLTSSSRVHFQHGYRSMASISIQCLLWISFMNLNLVCGRQFSRTFFGCCMPKEMTVFKP